MISYSQATDEIKSAFYASWLANSTAIAGYVPKVYFPNDQEAEKPDSAKYWARLSIQTVDRRQTAMSNDVCFPGKRRYSSSGLIFVQLFCPKNISGSDLVGRMLAEMSMRSFDGKVTPGYVVFRNARINEPSQENLFYRFNVVAEFEYDEVG